MKTEENDVSISWPIRTRYFRKVCTGQKKTFSVCLSTVWEGFGFEILENIKPAEMLKNYNINIWRSIRRYGNRRNGKGIWWACPCQRHHQILSVSLWTESICWSHQIWCSKFVQEVPWTGASCCSSIHHWLHGLPDCGRKTHPANEEESFWLWKWRIIYICKYGSCGCKPLLDWC